MELKKKFEAIFRATKAAFEHVDALHPELTPKDGVYPYYILPSHPSADKSDPVLIRQKLIETELGIYDPEGEEWDDPRFQAAFERREVPHGAHCDGCHGLNWRDARRHN